MNIKKPYLKVTKPSGVLAAIISLSTVSAIEYDLSLGGHNSYSVPGAFGGTAIFADHFTQPAGTGVFEPFLTIDANGQTSTGSKKVEQGYNTDGFSGMYLDQLRPQWNDRLVLGDLAQINIDGTAYYTFLLDANEPGGGKSLISVDNIRIYTSPIDNTALVGDNLSALDDLGVLRWALNDPTQTAGKKFNSENWIKLDSAQENVEAGENPSNGGSGKSDLAAFIPVSAFSDANPTDYLWFYNLNGAHYEADKDYAAEAGYEEWRAVLGGQQTNVPDAGGTATLFGLGLLSLLASRKWMS